MEENANTQSALKRLSLSPRPKERLPWFPLHCQQKQTVKNINYSRKNGLHLNYFSSPHLHQWVDVQLQQKKKKDCKAHACNWTQHRFIQISSPNKLGLIYYLKEKRGPVYSCHLCPEGPLRQREPRSGRGPAEGGRGKDSAVSTISWHSCPWCNLTFLWITTEIKTCQESWLSAVSVLKGHYALRMLFAGTTLASLLKKQKLQGCPLASRTPVHDSPPTRVPQHLQEKKSGISGA